MLENNTEYGSTGWKFLFCKLQTSIERHCPNLTYVYYIIHDLWQQYTCMYLQLTACSCPTGVTTMGSRSSRLWLSIRTAVSYLMHALINWLINHLVNFACYQMPSSVNFRPNVRTFLESRWRHVNDAAGRTTRAAGLNDVMYLLAVKIAEEWREARKLLDCWETLVVTFLLQTLT